MSKQNKKELLELRAKCVAKYFLINKTTITKTSQVFGISADTVGQDLNFRLKKIDEDLYKKVREQIDNNKRIAVNLNHNKENKFKKLEACFLDAKSQNHSYIMIKISNSHKDELKVHHFSSFADDLNFYKKHFNKNLTNKANKDIKILDFKSLKDLNGVF